MGSEQQDTNFNISNEHFFLTKNSINTNKGSSEVGVLEFGSPDTSMLNVRKNLR